jgi:hypothetical protein
MATLRFVALAGLLLIAASVLRAQDKESAQAAPAGTWKVSLPTLEEAKGEPLLLIKFEKSKEGKWSGEVLGSRLRGKGELKKIAVSEKALSFTFETPVLTMICEVKLPDAKATKLHGEANLKKDIYAVELERSSMTGLDDFDLMRERLANEPLGMRAAMMARMLMSDAADRKIKPAEVRSWAEKGVKSAALHGPNVARSELLIIAGILAEQKGFEATALQYARRAEAGLDEKKEGPVATKRVLDVLAAVLERAGKKEDAALVHARIKKLDFRVKPVKYAGRKMKNDRVVLAEMFTSAQAKSGVPGSMAIEALQKTFKSSEVVVISYHQHIPVGDPLGSPESEERLQFYGKNLRSLPTLLLNGKMAVTGGGGPDDAQDVYDAYVERIEPLLEVEPKGQLSLSATRKGDKVTITAEVSKLEETGEDIRLRVVLVESEVAYKGSGGGRVHYQVARHMPGGAEGTVMKTKSSKKTFTVDLADLKKKLEKHQAEVDKKRAFPDKERPLDLKKLRVVAFVQNDANNEVMQAALADVKGE